MTPVVVAGASGFVGSRVVAGLSRAGRAVLAVSRSPLPMPDDAGPVVPVRYDDVAGLGEAVRVACERAGLPLPGGAVASIGGWQLGPRLLDEPDLAAWRATLDSHLTAHLATIRALAPLLRASEEPHPAYVVLNGAARAEAMAGSGAVNVTGAGLAMLVQVLRLEEASGAGGEAAGVGDVVVPERAGRALRFHELVLDHAVAGDDRNVAPEREVAPGAVVHALAAILDDPAAAGVVHV
ncbi:hypothetical protein [Myceligenerans crystallogenes]|uniref:NAD(P)-dependent dehydrogenase, short-chain alcohol dehydrogenase family n=1 Tax=Myceligenerans crystallogenes TaxID=316335 RepID=A0ABN2NK33_9MICO